MALPREEKNILKEKERVGDERYKKSTSTLGRAWGNQAQEQWIMGVK